MAFNEATARWESHEYDEPGLGQVLADERFRQLRLQRTVAAASGITQPKLSAYERGRLTPSWGVFVKVLAAMDRRPVIRTEPLEPVSLLPRSISEDVDLVLLIVGDRGYRFEQATAAHLLGTGERVELIYVSVEGDPERLDEVAAAIADRNRAVTTKRGGGVRPHVAFDHGGRRIALELVREARRSIEVEYDGRRVRVAPMEDIYGEL